MSTSDAAPLVSICVCTFRRPEGLSRLLASLRENIWPHGVNVELVVVDNDAAGTGRAAFEAATAGWEVPARYIVEARPGVGHARTRCVNEAAGSWIAYIDDDEWATPGWLASLWKVQISHGADGVFGPVVAQFEVAAPPWLTDSKFYDRHRHATGHSLHWTLCASGNVLFRRQLFFDVGGFDPAFASSGSEDSDFFWRCLDRGARFVWADDAVAYESVPAERMTHAYLRKRSRLAGQNFARLHAHRQGWAAYVHFFVRGLAAILVYGPLNCVARVLHGEETFRYEGKLQGGLGKMRAAWAPVSREYGAGSSQPPDSQG